MPLLRSGVLLFARTLNAQTAASAPGEKPSKREGHPASSRSHALSSPLPLAPELAQIRLEVHLNRVPLGGDVALPHLLFRL